MKYNIIFWHNTNTYHMYNYDIKYNVELSIDISFSIL